MRFRSVLHLGSAKAFCSNSFELLTPLSADQRRPRAAGAAKRLIASRMRQPVPNV